MIQLGLDTPGRQRAARGHARRRRAGVGGPAFPTAGEDTNVIAVRGLGRRVHGQLALHLGAGEVRGRGGHAGPSRCPTTTGGRSTRGRRRQAARAAATVASTSAVGAFSEHPDFAYEATECITATRTGVLLGHQRQPGPRHRGLRRPRGQRGVPAWRRSSGSPWRTPPPAADRRTTARSPGASSASTTRRARSTPAHRRRTRRPDQRRTARGPAAVSTTTLPDQEDRTGRRPARDQRQVARRAEARLDAGRPRLRGDAAGHGVPDRAGGLRLAVRLPAHRPGEPVVRRPAATTASSSPTRCGGRRSWSRCSSRSSPSRSSWSSGSVSRW